MQDLGIVSGMETMAPSVPFLCKLKGHGSTKRKLEERDYSNRSPMSIPDMALLLRV